MTKKCPDSGSIELAERKAITILTASFQMNKKNQEMHVLYLISCHFYDLDGYVDNYPEQR